MKEQILKLRENGKTYTEIQKELGCSKGTIAYHCGKGQKEKVLNRSKEYKKSTCSCGNNKHIKSKLCNSCNLVLRRKTLLNKSLSEYSLKYRNNNKFLKVRHSARKFLKESGITEECKICKFDVHVEACHIKPISNFSDESKIEKVNSLENLVWLCPNHHYMLDNGLIKLD